MAATRPHRTTAGSTPGDRPASPGSAWSLEVRAGDDEIARVLELGTTPVRIGRGIQCEVRLNQVGLGDVQCIIRRRGDEWQVQPVGPPGRIWVDERPTDQQRSLPPGAMLRVGRATLIIHGSDPANRDRGSFDAPITIEADAEPVAAAPPPAPPIARASVPHLDDQPLAAESSVQDQPVGPRVTPTLGSSDAADDRARRWQARLDQRDQWLRDRQSEKRWEARWKAAGESLRSRSAAPGPGGVPPARPEPAAPPPPASVDRPASGRPIAPRSFEPRPVFGHARRPFEPESAQPRAIPAAEPPSDPVQVHPTGSAASIAPQATETAAFPTTAPTTPERAAPGADRPSPGGRTEAASPAVARPGSPASAFPAANFAPDQVELPATPAVPVSARPASAASGMPRQAARPATADVRPAETAPASPASRSIVVDRAAKAAPSMAEPPEVEVEASRALRLIVPPADALAPAAASPHVPPGPITDMPPAPGPLAAGPIDAIVDEGAKSVPSSRPTRTRPARPAAGTRPPAAPTPPPSGAVPVDQGPAPRPEPARPAAPRSAAASPPPAAPRLGMPGVAAKASSSGTGGKEWPSARTIFASQGTRGAAGVAGPPVEPTIATTEGRAGPSPSLGRRSPEPTEASPPDVWTIPLVLGWMPAAALVLALGLFGVGLALVWIEDGSSGNIALKLATRPEGTPSPPIDAQAIPKSAWWQTTAGHLAAWAVVLERVGNGEDRSADARILEADARSVSPLGARSRFATEPVPGPEADASGSIRLGPTRDIVTMTAMAHRLRRDGKRADAVRAYRAAFLTAASTARSNLGRPSFRSDPALNRYALPHSALLDDVARDMASAGDWTPDEWADAVPDFGPALLAVATALRGKDPSASERRLEVIARGLDRPLDPRFEAAEDRAAVAEALAERGRWTDAAAQYRRAVDAETRDLDRRVWWFNLAEVARKAGDDSMRRLAIEAAKGTDLGDEVTQRATNAHKDAPESPSGGRVR